jgi:hypothetical protein
MIGRALLCLTGIACTGAGIPLCLTDISMYSGENRRDLLYLWRSLSDADWPVVLVTNVLID